MKIKANGERKNTVPSQKWKVYRLNVVKKMSYLTKRTRCKAAIPATLRDSRRLKMKKICTICGRETDRTYNLYGYKCVCSKHMHQIIQYGHPLDTNPRTNNDLNDYTTDGITATFNLYNQKNEKIGTFIIDFDDLEKVKYHKWRINHNHVITGLPAKKTQKDLSYVILGEVPEGMVVDHINGNGFDNRKANLRICTQGQNTLNKSFVSNNTSNFIGVSYRTDRDRYDPEIRLKHQRCHLGYTQSKEEAVYKRYFAEQLLFGEFANAQEQEKKRLFTQSLSDEKKKELEEIVITKLKAKNMYLGN